MSRTQAARPNRAYALAIAFVSGITSIGAMAVTPPVDISTLPLYNSQRAHPNVAVTMSVEFPTVGSAFRDVSVRQYDKTKDYLGYFDASRCYDYQTTLGYFTYSAPSDSNHECNNQFSGSFMNFMTMSSVDEFRLALTGGNRVQDPSTGGAVLERANLPDGLAANGNGDFYQVALQFTHWALSNGTMTGTNDQDTWSAVSPSLLSHVTGISGSDNDTVHIRNCGTKVFFGHGGGTCQSPDNSLGEYNVRVLVCVGGAATNPPNLCQDYGVPGHSIFKPVGEAQRNADRTRFAAFGYLMDPTTDRYGGVLRTPMKYLGPLTYDSNLVPSVNIEMEIDTYGRLLPDPLGTAASAGGNYSGFINYINKFGSVDGVYKTFDPMGEMFYEAIRYYQNLGPTYIGPTPIAYAPTGGNAALTNAQLGYQPVVMPPWTDPILARCAANYIINISDTNTWDDTYLPGFKGSSPPGDSRPASRLPEAGLDAFLWTQRIGQLEAGTPTLPGNPNDVEPALLGLESRATGAGGGLPSHASYLVAGAAYWANTNDVRDDLPGVQTIKTISIDTAELSDKYSTPEQNLNGNNQRQLYLMGKYGGFTNTIDRAADTYPNPFYAADPANLNSAVRSNREWLDPTNTPINYLLASDPKRLIDGLHEAFARIVEQSGSPAGASLTSSNLAYSGANAFVGSFDSTKWSGNVLKKSISVDLSSNPVVTDVPSWSPATQLDALCGTPSSGSTNCLASANQRTIWTTVGSPTTRRAVNFAWGLLDYDYKDALILDFGTKGYSLVNQALKDSLSGSVLEYLRGYRREEGGALSLQFRPRDSALGDIINSAPVYVGAPTSNIPDVDYQSFFTTYVHRPPTVYVGANDGMLHAFDATSASEYFAYIPGYSKRDLNKLVLRDYVHKPFVDTTPKIQEIKTNDGEWKTVLVGASGGGSQGLFALDVSNPTEFGSTVLGQNFHVLFEFSDEDDADFGNVVSAPEIAKLMTSVSSTGVPTYEYFAVVTTYNNGRTLDQNGRPDAHVSPSSNEFLFLLSLSHDLNAPWVTGSSGYYKFPFPSNSSSRNGLGPVALLPSRTGDRATTALYFGDLQGNLWRFNTTVGTSVGSFHDWRDWQSALPAGGGVPKPIFQAHDDSGNPQPITERPEVSNGPLSDSAIVFFGTGAYLGDSDIASASFNATAQQSQYAILDFTTSSAVTRTITPTTSDLVKRTAAPTAGPSGTISVGGSPFAYGGVGAKRGWYMDFPHSADGERSINKPAVRTGLLTFDTLTLGGDVCGAGGGYIYQLDALTGLQVSGLEGGYASTVGIPGPPQIVDLAILPGSDRLTGEQINQLRQTTMVSGTTGKIDSTRDSNKNPVYSQNKAPPVGRVSWREISNWNDKTNH